MSGYRDYMLLLRPDEFVTGKIAYYKAVAESLVGEYPSCKSTAHISIAQYPRQKPFMFQPALDILQRKLETLKPVSVTVNNFKFFVHKNNTYTIYAAIDLNLQSDNWFNQICKHMRINRKSLTPHITVARTINENQFLRLWPHFRFVPFKAQCLLDNLTVLEKETLNPSSKWSICREFKFYREQDLAVELQKK
ncbi:2'-5' RNA ligase family protein [Mucilaginibacter sp. RS28]|uniref:2'-5' RNA ligase family protein n=1 Tax=Mucilaginibacter straminoryzae TaxID=2932774 RepID=A0A9X1X1Y2_9SPHI|nr:2'-5' RNA ligase family protein [Mucilaginibacter straminoryzae]MCJ8209513.1 2'-5' RNA ligase family protein [Mucilaginibacter straminoryzae]